MTTVDAGARLRVRRSLLRHMVAAPAALACPAMVFAADATPPSRRFEPSPGRWRAFDITTRVELPDGAGAAEVWLPLPCIDSPWQQSLQSSYHSNGEARLTSDATSGVRMLAVRFAPGQQNATVELTSRVQTQDRAQSWSERGNAQDPDLDFWTRGSARLPVDGIVRRTAHHITEGARSDVQKVQRIFDWIVINTYREPKVRGCGEGDIKAILESGNLSGKCADLNALFVGLCRASGVPARDVYGVRVAPSAFGYRELGANNPANVSGAQHCRAEVFLRGFGWVAMDPADVTKVMRMETSEWIRNASHPLVLPLRKGLFGGWEGNWVAFNHAHDVQLPGSRGHKLGFLMYPMAERDGVRLDSYAPDIFRYRISAREVTA
jgi:transglutaminase-like putative cysteine protease